MTFLALALLIIPALLGTAIMAALKVCHERITLIALGTIFGTSLITTLLFAATLVMPLTPILLATVLTISLALLVILSIATPAFANLRNTSFDRTALILWTALLFFSSALASKLISLSEEGITTSVLNAYGDLGWHVANITSFAERTTLQPENPIFAGNPLIYPFLADFHSALLVISGAHLPASITLPLILLLPIFGVLWYSLVRDMSASKTAGLIAVLLFLGFGATLGFIRLSTNPDIDYFSGFGSDPEGFHVLNPILSLFLPQRAFLFGFPLALAILWLLRDITPKRALIAGICAASLPLFHAHTILALIPPILIMAILAPSRTWLIFFATAGLIGLPEILYYYRGMQGHESFIRYEPWWTAQNHNLFWFWIKNTGLLLPATALSLLLPAPKHVKVFAIAALTIFVIANLWLFAPWAWDNYKLLIFWILFSLPLVAWSTTHLWKRTHLFAKAALVLILALHLVSAGIDLTQLFLPSAPSWTEWDQYAITAAARIAEHTQPGDSILTAPIHNSAAALAGRPIYLGHPAHVWSHGSDPWAREQAIGRFYAGFITELPETTPDFIVVGPAERSIYPTLKINPAWQLIFREGPYELYLANTQEYH